MALFVPLGFLYAVSRPGSAIRPGRILAIALMASAAIESVQLFEVTRYASLSDVLANGAGGYARGFYSAAFRGWRRTRRSCCW